MAHDHEASPHHKHPVWLYVVIVVLIVVLAAWGLGAYRGHKNDQQAKAKAGQLQEALQNAGLETYASIDQIARLYGTDGGAACDTPGKALADAMLKAQLVNGAGGPSARPVKVARETLAGQLLVIKVYCPDKLGRFQNFVDDLDFSNVVRS